MVTHTFTRILQWCREEKQPLLWSAFLAALTLFVGMQQAVTRAQLTGNVRYGVTIVTREMETITGPRRRVIVRAARIRRRLAARTRAKDVVIGETARPAVSAPVRSTKKVAQVPSTDTPAPAVTMRPAAASSAPVVQLRPGPGTEPETPSTVSGRCAPFIKAVHPVSRVPDWGSMRSPEEWTKDYDHMSANAYVSVPAYNMSDLTVPIKGLTDPLVCEALSYFYTDL